MKIVDDNILLTEEWLRKCGIVNNNRGWSGHPWDCLEIICRTSGHRFTGFTKLDHETGFYIFVPFCYQTGRPSEVVVKYVHELKNLYFALTGEELIIKEIHGNKQV